MEEEIKLFGDVNNFSTLYGLKNQHDIEQQINSVIKSTQEALEDTKKTLIQRKDEGDKIMKTYLTSLVDYEHKRDERGKIFNSTVTTFIKTKETNSKVICGIIGTIEKSLDCSLVPDFVLIPQKKVQQPITTKSISNIIKSGQKGGLKMLNIDVTKWRKGQKFKVAIKTSSVHVGSIFSVLDHSRNPLWRYEIPQEGIITSPTLVYSTGGYITYSIHFNSPHSEDLQVVLTAE